MQKPTDTVQTYGHTRVGLQHMSVGVMKDSKSKMRVIYMTHIHWVVRGTGTPKDKDEVNKREVSECDECVCDLETIGVPSIFNVIHSAAVLVRMLPTLDLSCEEKTERRKWN